jgi:hypothetical protein
MKLFDIPEAQHFCAPLAAPSPGTGQSLSSFHKQPPRRLVLHEGTTEFEIHRVSLLNAVERWILFGVADYRRAMDMFIPSNAPWAHVTLYYASFFGANAILGMFGGWLDHEYMVEVDQGTPKSQVLRVLRKLHSPSGYRGSHKIFWDNFYEGCNNTIAAWAPAELAPAVTPVNGDRTWLTTTRNELNYDMHGAYSGVTYFGSNFNRKKLHLLSGSIGQQLEITECMLKLAIYFAKFFKVYSFAYEGLGTGATRAKVFEDLVSKPTPRMVEQSEFKRMMFR